MARSQQFLLDKKFKINRCFGGSLLKNSNPKAARPISTKQAMHLVLKSRKAKKNLSMLKKAKPIRKIIDKQAQQFHIQIYEFANVGNHIHLLLRIKSRNLFKAFIRAITGLIARLILQSEKSHNYKMEKGFWDQRPFTRIVFWKNDFMRVKAYVLQNFYEAQGLVPYQPRKHRASSVPPLSMLW